MKKIALTFLASILAAVANPSPVCASIICLAPTTTAAGSITITAPITFTITTTSNAEFFILSGWVTSDGSYTTSGLTPNLAYSVNGTSTSHQAALSDNNTVTNHSVGPNDGVLYSTGFIPVVRGDSVTLLAGTYTLGATSPAAGTFNPQCTQTFTGSMFLADINVDRVSNIVSAVPEPSIWALLGVGAMGVGVVALCRRRAT